MAITKVYLLDVPFEKDYKHTLYFASATAQYNYFYGKAVKKYTDFSYQRKDKFIRVPDDYDTIKNCNYVMYQNTQNSSKWYYAFIDKIEYSNNEKSDIYITTDVIQTYLFDYTIKPSFIEREHVSDDTIGLNILPEGLDTGEYICNGLTLDTNMDNLLFDLVYVLGATTYPNMDTAEESQAGSGVYNGIYSGVKYFQYDSTSAIDGILEVFAAAGKTDSITGIFMAPKVLAPLGSETDELGIPQRVVTQSNSAYSYNLQINKTYGLGGYSCRNNKLKTYPYCYLLASNNQGSNAIYYYEDFSSNSGKCTFTVKGALTPGCSVRLTPTDYQGISSNDESSINLGKFPICNFANDMYTNWLTQNGINIGNITLNATQRGYLAGGLTAGLGVASMLTGNTLTGIGGTLGGIGMILDTMKQDYQHSLIPPQAEGNLNAGDVITASSKNNFHFYNMSIKSQYASIIDKYFDMFGYKVNTVKTPNVNHRANWWYTKTIDVNITGAIPNEDLETIKACYNNGITFWKDPTKIYDYTQSNGIVS